MIKIKICGIRTKEDILICNKYNPDYIGFVFYPKSKRYITKEVALELKKNLSNGIKSVGVFLDASITEILEIVKLGIIDLIQLHGSEDIKYIKELKKQTNLPIIKAYKDYDLVDYLLFDGKNPGSGNLCDWTKVKSLKPFFLAGGINKDNVYDAKKLNPYAIDVSSGVETNGFKDEKKIEELIRMVRE